MYAQAVDLPDNPHYHQSLTPNISAFIDDDAALTIGEVIARGASFAPISTKYIDFGLGRFRVWLKVSFTNTSDKPGTWRLNMGRQYIEELNAYAVRGQSPPELLMTHNEHQGFYERSVASRFLGADMQLAPGETIDVYIGYRSTATTFLPVGVGAIDAVTSRIANDSIINAVLNGALLAMMAIAAVMTSLLGWRLSLAFCLYIFAAMAYVFHADGYTYLYFWPNAPQYNDQLNLVFILLMPVFGLHFSRTLFSLGENAPLFNRALIGLGIGLAILAAISVPFYTNRVFMVAAYSAVPVCVLVQVGVGIVALRKKLMGATPFLAGIALVAISFVYATIAHVVPGRYNLDATLDVGHLALIGECIAFAVAILLRILGLRRQRDHAAAAELEATREKLRLTTQYQQSQQDYIEARKQSDMRRDQLSSVSHDLQQPLSSLRMVLTRIGGVNEEATGQMHSALDYLETLARDQLAVDDGAYSAAESDNVRETFPLNILLENVRAMFAGDAANKQLKLSVRPSDVDVQADPVALMRVISNLVSNAIKYTRDGGVLIGARDRGDLLRIEVWDTGPGMSSAEIERLTARHEKGDASDGHGIGLDIVSEISAREGYDFGMTSTPGKGSMASIKVPKASG